MNMEWQSLKLADLIEYQNGLWAGKTGAFTKAKVIRATEMRDNGSYDLSSAKELQVEKRKLDTRRVSPNSILLERSGGGENKPVGRVVIFGDDVSQGTYSFSNFTTLLLPKAEVVVPKYLFYSLYFFHLSGKTKLLQKAVIGIRNLDFTGYLDQEIQLPFKNGKPDLAEQKRIADKLDAVFSGTEKGLEEVLSQRAQAEELKQAFLASVFSNTEVQTFKLTDVADVNPRKNVGKLKATDSVSFVPMESVDEVTGTIVSKQARNLGAVVRGYTAFQNSDVLFAKITPCMENGKCAVAEGLENGLGFGSTEFYVIRPKENVSAEYLWHFLRQERVRVEAKKRFTGAAGHKRVPKDFIENLELLVPQKNGKPDLIRQQKAVAEVDKKFAAVDELLGLLEKQEQAFSSLRLSLLDAALKPKTEQPIASPLQYTASPRTFDIQQAVAQIIKRFQRGEVVIAKVLYIGQAIYGVPTNIPFTPQHFGPYDGIVKKAVMAGLSPSNRFFARRGTGTTQVLTLGENGGAILRYSTSELARKVNLYLDEMMPYFYQCDSASIERLATICKIIEDEKTADETIVKTKLQEWKPNRFTDQDVSRTLAFIKKREWDKRLIK